MKRKFRIQSNFHWWVPCRHWTEHECDIEKTNIQQADESNLQSFHQNTEPYSLYLHRFLLHLLRLWFQPRIKDRFHTDQYGRWRIRILGLLYQALYDSGSNDMLLGFSPHTVCSGRFMRLAVVLYRICASVLWERCNELMLEICRLLWVFFFSFQALLLTFSGILSVVELLCIPGEILLATFPLVVWSNNHRDVLLFLLWLAKLSAPSHVQ